MEKEIHIGSIIKHYLEANGQAASWLAAQMHCSRNNIYKILQKEYITTDQLLQISIILKKDFFVYYSDYLKVMNETANNH